MVRLVAIAGVLAVLGCSLPAAAAILFEDDFDTFIKQPDPGFFWYPASEGYPDTCEVTTVDGRSALHTAYDTGTYKGMVRWVMPLPVDDYWNLSVTFKPVGAAYLPLYIRQASYDHDAGAFTVFMDTNFWGPVNEYLFVVYDYKNGNTYWGPHGENAVWGASSDPDNWYTWTMNMGPTQSRITLADVNGGTLWSTDIPGVGTANIDPDYWELTMCSERRDGYPGVDNYIDRVIVTNDPVVPEPASILSLSMGILAAAGSAIRRRHHA